MRVFLTGGTGFIGTHIVSALVANGDEVTILTRNPQKIPALHAMAGVHLVTGSLEDHETIRRALQGQDACIHNAIVWDVEPTELQLKDTRASVHLFEAAANAGVAQMVYTSSTAVHRPFSAHMSELDRIAPDDFYGATKAASEAFLSAFSHQTRMRCNIIRPGPTVGGPAFEGAPVKIARRLEDIAQRALRGEEINVTKSDGRQFIGASDLARVYRAVIHKGADRETYLAAGRDFVTWEETAKAAIGACHSSSRLIVEEAGPGSTPSIFDVAKMERELGLRFEGREAVLDCMRRIVRRAGAGEPSR